MITVTTILMIKCIIGVFTVFYENNNNTNNNTNNSIINNNYKQSELIPIPEPIPPDIVSDIIKFMSKSK